VPEVGIEPTLPEGNGILSDLTAYVVHRQGQGASPASCNNELATLRRAFRLAVRGGELVHMPHVPMLTLNNARQGFFERHEFDAICMHLPIEYQAPVRFAFVTGWRLTSEVLPLTVDRVDLVAGVVRLDPGTTKNNEGRSFYLTAELRTVLTMQLASIEALKEQDVICPYVFHRPRASASRTSAKRGSTRVRRLGIRASCFTTPSLGRPYPRALRGPPVYRHGDGRSQDRGHLPTLRDRRRADAPGGGGEVGCLGERSAGQGGGRGRAHGAGQAV
jgi:integrase